MTLPIINTNVAADLAINKLPLIKQNEFINRFCHTTVNEKHLDSITGNATVINNGLTIFVDQFRTLPIQEIRCSCHRLFDILMMQITEGFNKSRKIIFPLKDYMALCDLKDENTARKQVSADLEILYRCSLSFKGKRNNFVDLRLCSEKGILNSLIFFTLTDRFYDMVTKFPVMSFPIFVMQSSTKDNPNSYYLARLIFEHIRMNYHKPNANRISVQTLLNACPNLQNWKTTKRPTQFIKAPFERDMEHLEENIKWEYCNEKGVVLTDQQISIPNFKTFVNLHIQFSIPNSRELYVPKKIKQVKKIFVTKKIKE